MSFNNVIKATDLKLISDCEKAGFSTQMTSSLLFSVTKKKWLSSQVKYVLTREAKNIIRNDIPDCKLSSASKLINYLEGQEDVVYVTLTDTHDEGILVRTKRKGRPTTEEKLERLKGTDSYKTICENLKLTGTPEILLACAWMTEEELRLLTMFPEVWFADVTNQTNNEKRQLLVVAGKDGFNQGFTGMRVFLPSEQYWVFDWFFNTCMVQMLKPDLIEKNRIVITDGDQNLYEPLRTAIATKISPWRYSNHKLCQFHLLCQPWTLKIAPLGGDSSNKNSIIKNLYNWCSTWFCYVETEEELNISVKEFFIHVRSDDVSFKDNVSCVEENGIVRYATDYLSKSDVKKISEFVQTNLLHKKDYLKNVSTCTLAITRKEPQI